MPRQMGPYAFVVEAWTDRHATWAHKVLGQTAGRPGDRRRDPRGPAVAGAGPSPTRRSRPPSTPCTIRRSTTAIASSPPSRPTVAAALRGPDGAPDVTASSRQPLWVDRELAQFGAWYELFPRSFGGFKGTAARVADVAAMGFDVLYLPPDPPHRPHRPQGRRTTPSRRGRATPAARGPSGVARGAIPPSIRTSAPSRTFRSWSPRCEPTGWSWPSTTPCSVHRTIPGSPSIRSGSITGPTGSIAHAENPPKLYQDIVPINFWPAEESDRVGPVGRLPRDPAVLDRPRASPCSGSTTRTPSRSRSGSG